MAFKKAQQKVAHLQKRSEEERYKAAVRYTVIAGILAAVIWLVILLPLQIYLNGLRSSTAAIEQSQPSGQTAAEPPLPDLDEILQELRQAIPAQQNAPVPNQPTVLNGLSQPAANSDSDSNPNNPASANTAPVESEQLQPPGE